MRRTDLTQLQSRIGGWLGTTRWYTITQDDIGQFATATRAREWIHVDEERCVRESPFGKPVVHGYLTLSLATAMVTELLAGESDEVGVNYGLNRVRFPEPVPVGSRVRAHGTLLAAAAKNGGVLTTIELVYEREHGSRPPCVAEVLSLSVPASLLPGAS